jgi:uncharacterized phage protein gp47/JayE
MSQTISGQTQGFSALVTSQVAVIQAAAQPTAPLDFTIGSILRALTEGSAWIALWLQGLILQVLTLTRAATSTGSDLDSWMNDYSLTRIAAVAATGQVTFARYTPTQVATIPLGAQVTTGDGSQIFAVIADTTQADWVASANSYEIAIGAVSGLVTVQALTAGTAGNVAAGTISILSTPISGVDYVTNLDALSGGIASETDAALRSRFANYINTRSLATEAAIGYAVTTVAGVVSYSITQNYDYSGAYAPGSFYVVFDDGTGNPPTSLISAVSNAVAASVGVGIRFGVLAPVSIGATVTATLSVASGYSQSTLATAASAAIMAYINGLPVGSGLFYNRLAQIVFDSGTGITNVSNLLLNGGTSDIATSPQQVIRVVTVTVS